MGNTIVTILLVEMHNRFRIAIGSKAVTALLQLEAEFGMVIDFPVKNDPNAPVFVGHWLMSSHQVNDAQPAETKRDWASEERAAIVWPAVPKSTRHGFQLFYWNTVPLYVDNPADSAHIFCRPTPKFDALKRSKIEPLPLFGTLTRQPPALEATDS
jgi:hypothetical protein